jgi:predicted nucleic acid-binding protein
MRGNEKAYGIINNETDLNLSVVTYIELIQGIRNKKELNPLRKSIKDWNAKIIYITEEISVKAVFYVGQKKRDRQEKLPSTPCKSY